MIGSVEGGLIVTEEELEEVIEKTRIDKSIRLDLGNNKLANAFIRQ